MTAFKVPPSLAFDARALQAGLDAIGAWARAGAWCAANRTRTFPDSVASAIDRRRATWDRLVQLGLLSRTPEGLSFDAARPAKAERRTRTARPKKAAPKPKDAAPPEGWWDAAAKALQNRSPIPRLP